VALPSPILAISSKEGKSYTTFLLASVFFFPLIQSPLLKAYQTSVGKDFTSGLAASHLFSLLASGFDLPDLVLIAP